MAFLGGAIGAEAIVAGADFWNPVGWAAAGVLVATAELFVMQWAQDQAHNFIAKNAPIAVGILGAGIGILQAKASRGGGKKPKNDVPDYAKGAKWDPSQETLHEGVDRVIGTNPVGVPGTGPTSDYNRIKKYLGPRRI